MLCCAGLFGGFIAGMATGIPWMPFVTASIGAGAGILADIKIFRSLDKRKEKEENDTSIPQHNQSSSTMDPMCCGLSFLGKRKKKDAEIQQENVTS